jgi:CRISPR-associated protein Cas4/Csa1 subtype I-A
MLQIRYGWRALDPIASLGPLAADIGLRGWLKRDPVLLPPEYLVAINDKRIPKRASISDIIFRRCATKRDIFLAMKNSKSAETRGRIEGKLAENYFRQLIADYFSDKAAKPNYKYGTLRDVVGKAVAKFDKANKKKLEELESHKTTVGQDRWLQRSLHFAGMHELASQEADIGMIDADQTHPALKEKEVHPAQELGLSLKVTPDFAFPDIRAIGDMKTGKQLETHHLLTCAGYALAHESEFPDQPIDFGVVYFFPTQQKTLSFAQVHTFVIDDELRKNFLDMRNDLYALMLRNVGKEPDFPPHTEQCPDCKYLEICKVGDKRLRE